MQLERYRDEGQLRLLQDLIDRDLSEPYSVFTYRYFLHQWPELCFLSMVDGECVGGIVCKRETTRRGLMRGYIAMLAVRADYRRKGLGRLLVERAMVEMDAGQCQEVVLEAEVSNKGALRLYEGLGFTRDKLLEKYYLNGSNAYRLKIRLAHVERTPEKTAGASTDRDHNDLELGEGRAGGHSAGR